VSDPWEKPAGGSGIEWTGPTLNCLAGCKAKSPGCRHCYAEDDVHRFAKLHYTGKPGLVVFNENDKYPGLLTFLPRDRKTGKPLGLGAKWTGAIACLPHKLMDPLGRARGTTWFSNSVSDIGFEPLHATDFGKRFVAAMFGLFTVCPQHIFQILTKRPETLLEWFAWAEAEAGRRQMSVPEMCIAELRRELLRATLDADAEWTGRLRVAELDVMARLVLASPEQRSMRVGIAEGVRHGIESAALDLRKAERRLVKHGCASLDLTTWPRRNIHVGVSVEGPAYRHRLDTLRKLPAALRFSSFEPLLQPVGDVDLTGIDWAIWGGESGNDAMDCDIDWLRSGVQQCRRDGTVPFVKQLGARPLLGGQRYEVKDAKGGDMAEWPADLRIREMPL
jgi:protein gp37